MFSWFRNLLNYKEVKSEQLIDKSLLEDRVSKLKEICSKIPDGYYSRYPGKFHGSPAYFSNDSFIDKDDIRIYEWRYGNMTRKNIDISRIICYTSDFKSYLKEYTWDHIFDNLPWDESKLSQHDWRKNYIISEIGLDSTKNIVVLATDDVTDVKKYRAYGITYNANDDIHLGEDQLILFDFRYFINRLTNTYSIYNNFVDFKKIEIKFKNHDEVLNNVSVVDGYQHTSGTEVIVRGD